MLEFLEDAVVQSPFPCVPPPHPSHAPRRLCTATQPELQDNSFAPSPDVSAALLRLLGQFGEQCLYPCATAIVRQAHVLAPRAPSYLSRI